MYVYVYVYYIYIYIYIYIRTQLKLISNNSNLPELYNYICEHNKKEASHEKTSDKVKIYREILTFEII